MIGGWAVYDILCRSPLANNDARCSAVLFVFVVAVAYAFQSVFSGRGALIHTGALMATMMSGNVAMLIIPNQQKVIAALVAGADARPGARQGGEAAFGHNNYLTLPVRVS